MNHEDEDGSNASAAPREAMMSTPTNQSRTEARGSVNNDESTVRNPRTGKSPASAAGFKGMLPNWWLEILCLGIVVLSLVAMALTLFTQQGRPLPHWPYKISVNSLVAVYTVVLKAAMLLVITEGLSQLKWAWYTRSRPLNDLSKFDLASRGPWGALQLIWTLRGRHVVATIGAFVVIATLVVDPVAQLLIRYYPCTTELPNMSANIPRTNGFSEMGLYMGALYSSLTYGYQSAINAGLFNPESVHIPFACPTGNCTFNEVYHTVAYCSSCNDSSRALSQSCGYQNYTTSYFNASSTSAPKINETAQIWRCKSSLPNGISAMSNPNPNPVLEAGPEYMNMKMGFGDRDKSFVEIITANLTNVYQGNCSTAAENATWSCIGHGAAVCTLYPCVRSYRATVSDTVLKETLLSSSAEWAYNSEDMARATLDVQCLSLQERQSLIDKGYRISGSTNWIGYGGNTPLGNSSDKNASNITVPSRCLYEIYEPTAKSLAIFMSSFFNGSVSMMPQQSYEYVTEGPIQLDKFFNAGNVSFESINKTFANIVDSMTAYIRQDAKIRNTGRAGLDSADKTPAIGRVFRSETCVAVRWEYIALPTTLVVLTLVFLTAMIFETTSNRERHDWKSSALALLFHGLDPEVRAQHGDMQSVRDMETTAQEMRVQLKRMEKGWGFTQTI